MPKQKSHQQASLAADTSAVRTQLIILRADLLSLVLEMRVDRVPLDAERVIVCKELISAKRITHKLVLGVVQTALNNHKGARLKDAVLLFCMLKTQLLEVVDKKGHSCDVVDAHSKETHRQSRDGPKPIVGDASILTDEVRAIANEIWELKTQSSQIAQKRKTLKAEPLPIVPPEYDALPASPSRGEVREAPRSTVDDASASTVFDGSPLTVFDECEFACTDADVQCAQIETVPEKGTTTSKPIKPKSSVSKKLAYVLLESIAEYLFSLCESGRMPHWENVDESSPNS